MFTGGSSAVILSKVAGKVVSGPLIGNSWVAGRKQNAFLYKGLHVPFLNKMLGRVRVRFDYHDSLRS
jgi:hypothetical protein